MRGNSESGHRNITHEDPISGQASYSYGDLGAPTDPELEQSGNDIAHRDALQHTIEPPAIKLIMVGKSVQEKADCQNCQPTPQHMLQQTFAGLPTRQARTKRKRGCDTNYE